MYLVLRWCQFSLTVLQQVFEHLVLLFGVECSDFKEAPVDNRSVEIPIAHDVADVVANVTQRQPVPAVGRQHHVDVFRPQVRQPGQALDGDVRPEMIQTVDEKYQFALSGQMTGDFVQCRREVFSQIAVRVNSQRIRQAENLELENWKLKTLAVGRCRNFSQWGGVRQAPGKEAHEPRRTPYHSGDDRGSREHAVSTRATCFLLRSHITAAGEPGGATHRRQCRRHSLSLVCWLVSGKIPVSAIKFKPRLGHMLLTFSYKSTSLVCNRPRQFSYSKIR